MITLSHFAVGDGAGIAYEPDISQTELQNETYRGPVNKLMQDIKYSNRIVVETVIPTDVGGFYIRELGVFDSDGELFAIANLPESYKPVQTEGATRDFHIRVVIEIENTENINLILDPSITIVTMDLLENHNQDVNAHFRKIDADKVDGYHAGNQQNQVGVSNGTTCENLNADLLDGHHLLGDFNEITGWAQNEKRTFALRYTDNYKYYRLTIVQNNGHATLCGIGELELFESLNDIMPLSARITLSQEKSLLLNNGKGYSLKGKVNELALICETYNLTNILDNALMYVGFEKQADNSFAPVVTTAQPVYSYNLQKHSNYNSVPDMISYTTSLEFKAGYSCSSSSVYNASYYAFNAFDKNMASKWMASVPGGNQYLQFDFPNYRKAARFGITTSVDAPAGSIKNAYIKGWNGEEWVVLCEIKNQPAWYANETRYFDADNICYCSKFKVEILELITATQSTSIIAGLLMQIRL